MVAGEWEAVAGAGAEDAAWEGAEATAAGEEAWVELVAEAGGGGREQTRATGVVARMIVSIASGKGGTGKTTVTTSLAEVAVASRNVQVLDCDVDASDLHLVLTPKILRREDFRAGSTASIRLELCTECDACRELCRFRAISENFVVDKFSCEGCKVCVECCPVDAVDFRENVCGEWFLSETAHGPMVHARLGCVDRPGGEAPVAAGDVPAR